MPTPADTDEPIEPDSLPAAFDDTIRESQSWLAERGETIVGSGCFHSEHLSGSIHSDFGPEEQDKDANQDYALAWLPRDESLRQRFRLVLAIGDGLTTSFRSEWASAIVCSVALRALVDSDPMLEPQDAARYAFHQAGASLSRLAGDLASDPAASCPPGQFASTWKYILRKGVLLQSTLTLAWLDGQAFRIAMLGDGGGVWRSLCPPSDCLLAQCDLDQHQVRALGPCEPGVHEFDCWHEQPLHGPFLCALHTDGIGRGLGHNPIGLLDDLVELQKEKPENAARRFIDRAVEERPRSFDDNLTLAVIEGE
jgi:hypothetical protein